MLNGVKMVQSSVDAESRRAQLRELLQRDGSITLSDVAMTFGVSEMTVRRDLQEMEQSGQARRVRGGAVAVGPEQFERRSSVAGSSKRVIAAKLVPFLPRTGAVAMDASSTVYRLAVEMEPSPITVLCTGIETAHVLRNKVRVVLSGGEIEETTGALVGSIARQSIESYILNRSFVSPSCLDPDFGLMESTVEGAEVKRALRRASKSLIVAADSSKLGETAMARALELADVDVLVTELDPAHTALDPYRDKVELR